MTREPYRFVADDGVAVAAHDWGPGDAGPPVILLHGFMSNAALNWHATGVVDALRAVGRRAVGIDLRGHGASDRPHDPAAHGRTRLVRDVIGLTADLGLDRFDVVGYSMGALIAAMVAVEARVERLVLAGVGAAAVEHGSWDVASVPRAELVAALRADDPASITHAGAASFRAFADRVGADRIALAAQAEARDPVDIPFDRITAPTLVVAGRSDPLARRPEVLVDALPDAQLQLLDGDHLSVTRNPRFPEVIADFLR